MKFDQDLEGLVWEESTTQIRDPKLADAMPKPFTPEYAAWLGEHVVFVADRFYGAALEQALEVAGKDGFILSSADLTFARKEIKEAAGKTKYNIDTLNTSTYEVASSIEDHTQPKWYKKMTIRRELTVVHGLNLARPGLEVSTHWGVPNEPVYLDATNDSIDLYKGHYREEEVEYSPGVSTRKITTRKFPIYDGRHDIQPKERQYSIRLPYEKCVKDYHTDVLKRVGTNHLTGQQAIYEFCHERALAGGNAKVYEDFLQELASRRAASLLNSASRWEKRSLLDKIRRRWTDENRIRPVLFCFTRNYTSTFDEDATFAVIPGGKLQ